MELIFKDKYFNLVVNGEKYITIRKGIRISESRELLLKPLKDDIYNYDNEPMEALLKRVEFKSLWDLTNQDAEFDGFQDKRELEEALDEIYSDIDEDTMFTIIEWE